MVKQFGDMSVIYVLGTVYVKCTYYVGKTYQFNSREMEHTTHKLSNVFHSPDTKCTLQVHFRSFVVFTFILNGIS
jgi:hypothetical protein